MRTSELFGAKISGFRIYGVSARTRGEEGLSQCGHFLDQEDGVNFSRFCADS